MKLLYFYFVFVLFSIGCSCSSQIITSSPIKDKDFSILSEMDNIKSLPDDYFYYPKGDSITQKIIDMGEPVVPPLIEKINDTTLTQVRIADTYNYTVGDVAFLLLPEIYRFQNPSKRNTPPLRLILIDNFLEGQDDDFSLELLYYQIFIDNSEQINCINRNKLYKIMKQWYDNSKIE